MEVSTRFVAERSNCVYASLDCKDTWHTPQPRQELPTHHQTPRQIQDGETRRCPLEMRPVQETCSRKARVLPGMRRMVGKCLRCWICPHWTCHIEQEIKRRLGLAELEPTHVKRKTEKLISQKAKRKEQGKRQRERKRKGQREGEGDRPRTGTLPVCSDAHEWYTLCAPGSFPIHAHSDINATDAVGHFWAKFRACCSHPEGLSGRESYSSRNSRSAREDRFSCWQAAHPRAPQSNNSSWQGTTLCQRIRGWARKASFAMAVPCQRLAADVGETAPGVRGPTTTTLCCNCQGKERHGVGAPPDPSAQCKSCWQTTARTTYKDDTFGVGTTSQRGGSGGESIEETAPSTSGEMCPAPRCQRRAGEETYGDGEETGRRDRDSLRRGRSRYKATSLIFTLQVIATAGSSYDPSPAFGMKHGSVLTCPDLVNVRRGPKTGLRVGFLCAEAYSWSTLDDQSAACTADHLKDSQNLPTPFNGVTPLEAIRDAWELRWMVLNDTVMDQLSSTTIAYLNHETLHQPPQLKDNVHGEVTPHVFDLWCEDPIHGIESLLHDFTTDNEVLHLQQTSHNFVEAESIGTTWRTWPEVNEDLANILAENELQEDTPDPPVVDGPFIFEDIEEWTRLATRAASLTDPNIVLTIHGLKDIDIGVRRTYLHSLNVDIIEEALHGLWPHLDFLAKKVHIVNPQPIEEDSVVVILEFFDLWNPTEPTLKPILHECLQPEFATIVRSAWYSPQSVTKDTFPLDRDDCPISDNDIILHVWIRGRPLLPHCAQDVDSGDLVNIRAVSSDAIEPWVIGFFPDAIAYKQSIVEQTALDDIEPVTWTFVGTTPPGSPACVDRFQADWLRFHDPYFVVQMFLEVATFREINYDGLTLHAVRPTTGSNITFLYGQSHPERPLVHVVFSAKWNDTWQEQYCYQPSTDSTVAGFLRFANLDGQELSILHCARLVQGDALPLRNGDRLELEFEEISDEVPTESNDTNEASLMQRSRPSLVLGLTKSTEEGNDFQSHVFDRWCIDCQEPSRTTSSPDEDGTGLLTDTCKPNHGIMPDFDSIIPYRHRARNGQLYNGRRYAPPNWDEHPMLQTAGNIGAVYRDGSDELRVRVRTWIASHHTTLILPHRDITVRAQLMHQLEVKVRRAWPDQIGDADRVQLTVVQPSPRAGNAGHPKMHLLVELNRATASRSYPILIAHREIDANGPSDNIHWIPVLADSPIGIDLLHRICAPPCNADQMLVPQIGRTRRWLSRNQRRDLTAGLFLPIWWDLRIGQAAAPTDGDASTLMQTTSGTSTTHVSDRWCVVGEGSADGEQVDHIKTHVPGNDMKYAHIVERTPTTPGIATVTHQPLILALDQGSDEAITHALASWSLTHVFRFRSYGFFEGDVGSRDVLIEASSMHLWALKVAEIWSDYEDTNWIRIGIVTPQPSEQGIDVHVLVYSQLYDATKLILLEVVTTAKQRTVAESRRSDNGYQVAARAGFHFTTDSVVRFRHQETFHYGHFTLPGEKHQLWHISIDKVHPHTVTINETEEDVTGFMQRATPTQSPSIQQFRLIGLHNVLTLTSLDDDLPIFPQLEVNWPVSSRAYDELSELYEVTDPPPFTEATDARMLLLQFSDDYFEQAFVDDVLIVISIVQQEPSRKQKIKATWAPRKLTRQSALEFLRVAWYCDQPDTLCFLYKNNNMWAFEDYSVHHLTNGDHIRLQYRSTSHSWCDIEHSEAITRSRRVFISSDEEESAPRPTDTTTGRGTTPSERSRSRGRQVEQDSSAESLSLIQRSAIPIHHAKPNEQVAAESNFWPHVHDLWCADRLLSAPSSRVLTLSDKLDFPSQHKDKDDTNLTMTAIRIFSPPRTGLPEYIEIQEDHDVATVKQELTTWGHHQIHCTRLSWEDKDFGYAAIPWCPTTQASLLLFNPDTGEHFWYGEALNDEVALMRLLGLHGHRRCVILDKLDISSHLQVVYYIDTTVKDPDATDVKWHTLQLPRVEYPRDQQNRISQCISLTAVENGGCLLRAPMPNIATIMDIFQTPDFLQRSVEELTLLQECREAIFRSTSNTRFDRLRIYVDGTSNPAYKHWEPALAEREGTPDAWAFAVIGETYNLQGEDSDYHFLGFATHPVCYEPQSPAYIGAERIGSDVAEREAMFWAGIWRLTYDDTIPTIFLSDCATAGQFAFGHCGTTEQGPALQHALLRGVYQALETALTTRCVYLQHVKGHSGEIWNEFCDIAAKWSANTVHWLPRPQLDMRILQHLIPSLWMYLADDKAGLPPITQEGHFAVQPPALPVSCETPAPMPCHKTSQAHITLSVATANVQTLGRGPDGFQGKLQYLQEQFKAYALHVVGIQEARTEECYSGRRSDFLRLASGHDQGHYGTELWISRIIPYAWVDNTPQYFQPKHLVTLHKDPRRLVVRVMTPHLDCIFVVLHGPQSGRPQEERERWWSDTTDMLLKHKVLAPLIVLGDLNATTGPQDHRHVHCYDDTVSKSTPLVTDCVQQADLSFVTTMNCHQGDHYTWTSPDGQIHKRIDHILVPADWGDKCMFSTVLTDIDMGNGEGDYRAIGAMLQWTTSTTAEIRPKKASLCHRHMIKGNQNIKLKLSQYQSPPWHCDINSQVLDLNSKIHEALSQGDNKEECHPRRKPYITDEIWELRSRRNRIKKLQSYTMRALNKEIIGHLFLAWKRAGNEKCSADALSPNSRFEVLLRCCKLKQGVELTVISRGIKQHLREAKNTYIRDTIQDIPVNSSSSHILTLLRPCIGTSNSRKRSRPGLPQVLTEDGETCTTTTAACDRWIEYFAQMECGQRVTGPQLYDKWRANLEQLRCTEFDEPLTALPTLFDLERSFRRVAVGKAVGQDAVPPELCNALPCEMARATFPQLMKLAIHGQEALVHKGGRLAVAYKRGPTNQCSSYRSLLVSSHVGKTIHRSLRQHQADLYESYLQGQQIGGRRKIPVGFALHLTKAHVRQHLNVGHSVGVIFLDLTEAFYRVIRPMALGGRVDDAAVAEMTQRLGLDPGTLHDLHMVLREPSAVERANIPPLHQRYLRALHTDTRFQIGEQTDHVRTTAGTRPGDSFADVVFGYLWARVLKVLERELQQQNLLTYYPHIDEPGFHGHADQQLTAFIGPTWCDDLSICIWDPTASGVERKASLAAGIVLDLCKQHGMTPNLGKGKTAILLGLQGPDSRRLRRRYFGSQTAGQMTVIGEHQTYQIEVIGEYKHLGGLIHAKGDMRREVSRRLAIAHAAFAQHRKILYKNPAFSMKKRTQLFSTLVLTKLTYGMETWDLQDPATKQRLHVGIMRLYTRLLGGPHDEHLTDNDILMATELPTPTVLLRQARLRYLGLLYTSASKEIWTVIAGDKHWRTLIEDDIQWLWQQLQCSSPLLDPETGFDYWEFLMRRYPGYWKRLIKRGVLHSCLQDQKHLIVDRAHESFVQILEEYGTFPTELPKPTSRSTVACATTDHFGCIYCEKSCKTAAGEAVHMQRKHGHNAKLRYLFDSTHCPACLREYHIPERVHQHLRGSTTCRQQLMARGALTEPAPGSGSIAHRRKEVQHNRLTPFLIGHGPQPQQPGDFDEEE